MSKHSNRFFPDTHVIVGGRPCHFAKEGVDQVEHLGDRLFVTLDLSNHNFIAPVEDKWELYVDVVDLPDLNYTDVAFVVGFEDSGVLIPRVVLNYDDGDGLSGQKQFRPEQYQQPKVKH